MMDCLHDNAELMHALYNDTIEYTPSNNTPAGTDSSEPQRHLLLLLLEFARSNKILLSATATHAVVNAASAPEADHMDSRTSHGTLQLCVVGAQQ